MAGRFLFLIGLLVSSGCTASKGRSTSNDTLPRVRARALQMASSASEPSAIESYLLYFPSSRSAGLNEKLIQLDAQAALGSQDPAVMTAFLRLHGSSPLAKQVFENYISFLTKRIHEKHQEKDMVLFLRICPNCSQAASVRENLAMIRLRALGPSPSPQQLSAIARTWPGTKAAALARQKAARLTVDHAVLFGGPEAWLGSDWPQASPEIRKEAARLALVHGLRTRNLSVITNALRHLGTSESIIRELSKAGRRVRLRIIDHLTCAIPAQPRASIPALEVLLSTFQDTVTKRDALETLAFMDDPRSLWLIVQNVASSDLLVHVAAVAALKARLKRNLPWDIPALRLIESRLAAHQDIAPVVLRLSFLRLLSERGSTPPLPPPSSFTSGQPVLRIIRAHLLAVAGRGTADLIKECTQYFEILRRNFPQPIGRHNLALALAQERASAALLMLLKDANTPAARDTVTRIKAFRTVIVGEITRAMRLAGREYTPSLGHPVLEAYEKASGSPRKCPALHLPSRYEEVMRHVSSFLHTN